jgi:isopenicillin N synthase-like dioxygenase
MSIPTIDLRGFGDGSSAQDKATAAQLLAAYRDVGFAYLMHPIPQVGTIISSTNA